LQIQLWASVILDRVNSNGIMLLLEPASEHFLSTQTDSVDGFGRFQALYRALLTEANQHCPRPTPGSPFLIQILTDDVLVRGDTQLLTVVVVAVV